MKNTRKPGLLAAIASLISMAGWGQGSAREIPAPNPQQSSSIPQSVRVRRSKKRKNPMHGICGAESNRFTRHAGIPSNSRRRHNEERRAEAGRELGRIIAKRQS